MKDDAVIFSVIDRDGDEYDGFLDSIRKRLADVIGSGTSLFTTNAAGLWDAFLDGIPDDARQHYTCHACRDFVNRYGGLVSIAPDGMSRPVMWDATSVPQFFAASVKAIERIISKAKVNGVFVPAASVLGQPVTGVWHHMAAELPAGMVFKSLTMTAGQRTAEKREDFKLLIAGLLEYTPEVVNQALTLLRTESLYRSEKVLGVAEWLADLHAKRAATKRSDVRENLVWLATATAPAGFCHVKSTMIGTLLDDIAAGMAFDAVRRRFADKMHPLQYQRPQAPPDAGNIAQAEKIIEQLGAAGSLARRFARIDELQLIWRPAEKREEKPAGAGVFARLRQNGNGSATDMDIPPVTMTWEKFYKTVLPTAEAIEYFVTPRRENYSVIVTAVNFDAPPIIQWDMPEARNPFNWYVYHGCSTPESFNLEAGWRIVTGVCFQPSMWAGFEHHGKSVHMILEGAKDTRYKTVGTALFPETLKSELHGIRATIEAYSRQAVLEGYDEASACGLRLQGGMNWDAVLRVTAGKSKISYRLDRWD